METFNTTYKKELILKIKKKKKKIGNMDYL